MKGDTINHCCTRVEFEIRLGSWFFANVERNGHKAGAWVPFALTELAGIGKILSYADVSRTVKIQIFMEPGDSWNPERRAVEKINKYLTYAVGNWKTTGRTTGDYAEREESK